MDLAKTASASSAKEDVSSQNAAQNNLDAKIFAERSALGLLGARDKNPDLSQFKTSESNLQIGLRGAQDLLFPPQVLAFPCHKVYMRNNAWHRANMHSKMQL